MVIVQIWCYVTLTILPQTAWSFSHEVSHIRLGPIKLKCDPFLVALHLN